MTESNYWTRKQGTRLSRRGMLRGAALGGAGLAGAALIGCGGDDAPASDGGSSSGGGGGGGSASTDGSPPLTAAEFAETSLEDLRTIYAPTSLSTLPGQLDALENGPAFGGTYRYSGNAPTSNWDILSPSAFALTVQPMHSQLLTFKWKGDLDPSLFGKIEVEPDLPKSWEVSEDGLTHTFQLPDEPVYWHDVAPVNGREFTSDDLAFGIEALRQAPVQSGTYRDVVKVEATDDKTVVISFGSPAAYFARESCIPIQWLVAPEHVEAGLGDAPIGTGPFQLDKSEADIGISYDRNPRYWKEDPLYGTGKKLPYLDRMERTYHPDRATYQAAWASGQTDYGSNPNMSRREIVSLMELRPDSVMHMNSPPPSWHPFIAINNNTAPFNDARVRRGLSMAIDRQGMIDGLVGGLASPGYYQDWNFFDRPGNPWPWTLDELGPYMKYDPAEAKKMLSAAGFDEGLGRTVELGWGTNTDGLNNSIYEAMSDGLRTDLGIDINRVLAVDGAAYNAKLYGSQYQDLHVATPRPAWDPHGFSFGRMHSESGGNYYNINDPILDELTEKQQVTLDVDERRDVVRQIMERDLDQMYTLWGIMVYKFMIRDPKVFNLGDHYLAWMTPGWGERKLEYAWKQA
ncbi:MAG: ABC transporter substrate-binding protein [Dehalococcoidia bacterium]|nr:ABC transporter substrate-binding protein [Dehalococcoidia bacterium]